MKYRALLGICLGVAALSAGGCALDARGLRAEGAFDRTLSVSGSVELEAHTGSGTIRIQTGEPGVVRVRGRVRCATSGPDSAPTTACGASRRRHPSTSPGA